MLIYFFKNQYPPNDYQGGTMNQKPETAPQQHSSNRSDHSAVRQSFRVPVDPKDNIKVMIKGEIYRVTNISPEGVGIFYDQNIESEAARLMEGSEMLIEDCDLIFPDAVIKHLTAKIIRFSPTHENGWENGLQWINMADEDQIKIADQVSKIKKRLLASAM